MTPHIFLGGFGFPLVFHLLQMYTYGVSLEATTFENRTADFAYFLFFSAAAMLPCAYVMGMAFTAAPLVFTLIYVWSRYNPSTVVNLMGVVKLQSFFLPWAMIVLGMLFGNNPVPDLVGIFVGHVYYFLTELSPRAGGAIILRTPLWFEKALMGVGVGQGAAQFQAAQRQQQGFRAFGGGGQRLGR